MCTDGLYIAITCLPSNGLPLSTSLQLDDGLIVAPNTLCTCNNINKITMRKLRTSSFLNKMEQCLLEKEEWTFIQ